MANEGQRISEPNSSEGLELADSIKKIAAHNARASLADDKQLMLFLRSWWSKLYNRPLKDPLLQSYTLEELLYEFYDKVERNLADEERASNAEIREEEVKDKGFDDWAAEEERKEAEATAKKSKSSTPEEKPAVDPAKDPANVKWMEEQIRLAKAELGDDFGDDLELNFNEK